MKFKKVSESKNIDFDDWIHVYDESLNSSLWLSGEKNSYFDLYKVACLRQWGCIEAQAENMILDFGCGIGNLSNLIAQEFPQSIIYGYDISSKSIETARKKWDHLNNLIFESQLPETKKFDLITAANVFHHIKRKNRLAVLSRLRKLLKVNGNIAIFEHNPINPLTLYTVKNCCFDAEADLIRLSKFVKLAFNCNLDVRLKRYIVFFPNFLRLLRKHEHYLGFLPLGAQYMLLLGNNLSFYKK